ncbi:hypothetical protein MLD38_012031 [Melastoma candidum]|uniref:Uncharacterized protein n=1 Tax=Melastoma candidum TaxID=119954 RepID=A0ACB9R4K9_9MYRT|nr:hypothetical protein MLD38_012031 [Melastoma candidum]
MHGQSEVSPSGLANSLKDHPIGLKLNLESSSAALRTEAGQSKNEEDVEANEFQDVDWSDLTETQLEELALANLDLIFRNAIKKIASCGFTEEVATKAVLSSGLCYGSKDIGSNIIDNALAYLRSGLEVDLGREHCFTDLRQLGKYVLIELVCVLQEVRPFFSTGDAMWCLLICDMNVSHACAMDAETLSQLGGDGSGGGGNCSIVSPNMVRPDAKGPELHLPNPSNSVPALPFAHGSQSIEPSPAVPLSVSRPESSHVPKVLAEHSVNSVGKSSDIAATASASEEKINSGGKKGHSNRRDYSLRQKSIHLEKHYRAYGSKSTSRASKLSSLSGLLYDKKSKSETTSKGNSLKITEAMLADLPPMDSARTSIEHPSTTGNNLETSTIFPRSSDSTSNSVAPVANHSPASGPVFTATNTDLSLSLLKKSESCPVPVSCQPENCSFTHAGIPFDRYSGQWIPQCKKDEMIMKLVPKVQEMQSQLHEWTEWANQKVMQATRRLGKDKAELKALRQEKEEVERLKKEKQASEENTMKKLSEMENALCKASGQVERANTAVKRLEVENAVLRQEMEAAKLCATESAASCNEVSKREKKTLMKLRNWDKQKIVLQEEFMAEKQTLAQIAVELEQAKDVLHQFEARRMQEEKAGTDLNTQIDTLRKEREQIESSLKAKEETARSKLESNIERHKEENQKLEKEISELRLKTDSFKYAALWKGLDVSYANRLVDKRNGLSLPQQFQALSVLDVTTDFQDTGGVATGVKRERECVMCLSEEMSVVFMPCAHQVVCSTCNELHEKQGMKDCPSCRCPIQRRVTVRFNGS